MHDNGPIGYVLKMYPRFSETFVVSEILAREAAGEEIVIFSLRPPTDPRFHPELARVKAPVIQVPRPASARGFWEAAAPVLADPDLRAGVAEHLGDLAVEDHSAVAQGLQLAALAREAGVRHLHAHFATVAAQVARIGALVTGIPYSITAHAKDIFHEDVETETLRRRFADADHVVTISRYNLEHLRTLLGEAGTRNLRLVHNGLELERFPYRPSERRSGAEARLLTVGRLVEKKGLDLLIDAVARMRDSGERVRLDIVGEGPLREQLAAQIRELGVDEEVRLLGPRTQDEVVGLMRDHDLFVGAFVVGADGNADGLPTVLLEAMACGIPCVAADVTAVPEVIRDGQTGVLVTSGDADALVRGIAAALSMSDRERREITDAARALVEREHSSAAQARALEALQSADRSVITETREEPRR